MIDSIEAQTVIKAHPEKFEKMVVDSGSDDGTAERAAERGWRVVKAPRGKLTARDLGMRNTSADLVFSIDADVYYPPNHFDIYLQHFEAKDVVGVYGPFGFDTRAQDTPIWLHVMAPWLLVGSWLMDRYFFLGQNSAYRRKAYFDTGGFDLSVDQLDHASMRVEEEFNFRNRLTALGLVVFEASSIPFTSPRRITGIEPRFDLDRKEKRRFAKTSWFS